MEVFPIFSIGIGVHQCLENIDQARALFNENKSLFTPTVNYDQTRNLNYKTTLANYRSAKKIGDYKKSKNLTAIQELILEKSKKFYEICGYDVEKYNLTIQSLWFNEMTSDSSIRGHYHYGFQISGCMYVDMPENSNKIMFTNPTVNMTHSDIGVKTYTQFNAHTWEFSPNPGDMYLWRSDLVHEVLPFKFDGVRRCLAFDILVEEK